MKTIKVISVFLLATLLATGIKAQQSETMTVPLSEPGKAYKLHVSLLNGSIKIVGYEGKDIVIDAEPGGRREKAREKDNDGTSTSTRVSVNVNTNRDKDRESKDGMKRLVPAGNGMDISAEEKSNRVTIHSNSWSKAITLTIKVPANGGTLNLSSTNDGDITVTNVNAEMEINNTNGAIYLTNVSGSAVANTVNGNMVASFKTVDPKAPMAFSTLNGKVDVSLPADAKANLKAKSDQGEVYSDFNVEIDKSAPKVNRTNEKGMYRLNIEDWVYGKINGGGPEILMKTMNGNIYIRKAK